MISAQRIHPRITLQMLHPSFNWIADTASQNLTCFHCTTFQHTRRHFLHMKRGRRDEIFQSHIHMQELKLKRNFINIRTWELHLTEDSERNVLSVDLCWDEAVSAQIEGTAGFLLQIRPTRSMKHHFCEHRPLNVSLVAETESGWKWDGSPFDLSSSEKEMGMIFGNEETQLISFTMQNKSSWLHIRLNPPRPRPIPDPLRARPVLEFKVQTFTFMHLADAFIQIDKWGNINLKSAALQSFTIAQKSTA